MDGGWASAGDPGAVCAACTAAVLGSPRVLRIVCPNSVQLHGRGHLRCYAATQPSAPPGCPTGTDIPTGTQRSTPKATTPTARYVAQDNAPSHKGAVATTFLRTNRVRVLDWPPMSPDLSIIENMWGEVKRLTKVKRPKTAEDITRHAKAAWGKLNADRAYITALFDSMPRRMQAVVDCKGKAINY